MMILYVARHAEAEHNLLDTFHDTTLSEVSLTKKGHQQALELAKKLKDVKLDAIYASRLQRTQQTAEAVNHYHNLEITIDPRLDDIISGIAGRPVSEFRDLLVQSDDPWNAHFDGGESYEENKSRATDFLRDLATKNYRHVLVVASGGIANILYGTTQGMANEQMYSRPIANAELLTFKLDTQSAA